MSSTIRYVTKSGKIIEVQSVSNAVTSTRDSLIGLNFTNNERDSKQQVVQSKKKILGFMKG